LKLQTRTNLNYIFVSAIIYVIVAVSFYLAVEHVIYEEVDRRLLVEKTDFENFIDRNNRWEPGSSFVEDKIVVTRSSKTSSLVFSDTLLLSRYDSQRVPFRQISFDKRIGDELYRVAIRKSLIESNQLLKIITIVMLVVLSGGLSLLYIFQQRTSKRLWQPFYDTLIKAKDFNVHHGDKLTLSDQEIYEFNELNSALNKMTDKILGDYQSLREFTENASHEIQTPLALINSRVEGLIQDSSISATHMQWIQDIHESVMRLSKLNHALLLLAKIENGQFQQSEWLDLKPLLEKHLSVMDEVFALKKLNITVNIKEPLRVKISHSLADILISNLLNNAVKHNLQEGGSIAIDVSSSGLKIVNTGLPLTGDPKRLFERFQKQNKSTASLGLGLAIVKKICEISELDLDYNYSEGLHAITLTKVE
jgi:signal transduction histidine kinase